MNKWQSYLPNYSADHYNPEIVTEKNLTELLDSNNGKNSNSNNVLRIVRKFNNLKLSFEFIQKLITRVADNLHKNNEHSQEIFNLARILKYSLDSDSYKTSEQNNVNNLIEQILDIYDQFDKKENQSNRIQQSHKVIFDSLVKVVKHVKNEKLEVYRKRLTSIVQNGKFGRSKSTVELVLHLNLQLTSNNRCTNKKESLVDDDDEEEACEKRIREHMGYVSIINEKFTTLNYDREVDQNLDYDHSRELVLQQEIQLDGEEMEREGQIISPKRNPDSNDASIKLSFIFTKKSLKSLFKKIGNLNSKDVKYLVDVLKGSYLRNKLLEQVIDDWMCYIYLRSALELLSNQIDFQNENDFGGSGGDVEWQNELKEKLKQIVEDKVLAQYFPSSQRSVEWVRWIVENRHVNEDQNEWIELAEIEKSTLLKRQELCEKYMEKKKVEIRERSFKILTNLVSSFPKMQQDKSVIEFIEKNGQETDNFKAYKSQFFQMIDIEHIKDILPILRMIQDQTCLNPKMLTHNIQNFSNNLDSEKKKALFKNTNAVNEIIKILKTEPLEDEIKIRFLFMYL